MILKIVMLTEIDIIMGKNVNHCPIWARARAASAEFLVGSSGWSPFSVDHDIFISLLLIGAAEKRLGQHDYQIEFENRGQYRRNRVHLRPKASAFTRDAEDELDLPTVDANEQTIPDKTVPEPDQVIHCNSGVAPSPTRPKRITKTPVW